MEKITSLTLLVIISLFLSACESSGVSSLSSGQEASILDDSQASSEKTNEVVSGSNQFAFDFYKKAKDDPINKNKNIFFSPYSMSVALAMTYEGAEGKTAKEMQETFHFPEDNETRQSGFAGIHNSLNKKDKEYQLHTTNALWAENTYEFKKEYFDLISKYYGGEVTSLDFLNKKEESRLTINKWVEDWTNDKIKDLIPSNSITPLTRLVLTNAIYFKGDWAKQFDKKDTRKESFKISENNEIKTDMMKITGEEAEFYYMEDDEVQVLKMFYEGNDLSMLVILPKEDSLVSIENIINNEKLLNWKSKLVHLRANVYLPKFTFESKYFMNEMLKEMGMPTAFSESADFSGMDGTLRLYISDIIHQAFVEVNEEGTEAVAATAVIATEKSISPNFKVFKADHPFIFLIQEEETGNILFMGRVIDPTVN